MKMNKTIFVVMIFMLLLVIACQTEVVLEDDTIDDDAQLDVVEKIEVANEPTENLEEEVEEKVAVETIEPEAVLEDVSCSISEDCEWNEKCIEGVCGKISDIYDTENECSEKCNFDNVQITTSDGDELTLSRGQGSYTGAGAVEWKLLSSANYCQGEKATPVAIELIKKNYGKILSKEVIILEIGKKSRSISHPTIDSIDFTLEVECIDESCS